jgi:hypothetical protein
LDDVYGTKIVQKISAQIGVPIVQVQLTGPDTLAAALKQVASSKAGALVPSGTPRVRLHWPEISAFAIKNKIASIGEPGQAEFGGLFSYGAHGPTMMGRVANWTQAVAVVMA